MNGGREASACPRGVQAARHRADPLTPPHRVYCSGHEKYNDNSMAFDKYEKTAVGVQMLAGRSRFPHREETSEHKRPIVAGGSGRVSLCNRGPWWDEGKADLSIFRGRAGQQTLSAQTSVFVYENVLILPPPPSSSLHRKQKVKV